MYASARIQSISVLLCPRLTPAPKLMTLDRFEGLIGRVSPVNLLKETVIRLLIVTVDRVIVAHHKKLLIIIARLLFHQGVVR